MRNKERRNRENKPQIVIDPELQPPGLDHTRSAFLNMLDSGVYVVHRIGPSKDYEKLYGPYHDAQKAKSKLSEHVEAFVREFANSGGHVVFKGAESAKVVVDDFISPDSNNTRCSFFFAVKELSVS